ncbi:MAG TPA: lytic transglycosylase domain-containing protein [Bryobacteraceae bacterium]|jgi:soluble lytic murein transglycosylase-like protein|nr:lytic transglycosylase domain-containing protein [Bryobacteraceae bacterium]
MRFLVLLLLTAGALSAGEYALLANGARMHVDRHEVDGGHVRLYNSSGYIEMPANTVTGFEVEESAPAAAAPAPAPPPVIAPSHPSSPVELADAAADKYGLPRQLVRSVMAAESGFQRDVVSPKGAIGLMQLMPETAQLLGADPHDPAQNVDAGVRYLRDLLIKYDGGLWHALAAYNAGPAAVDKYHWVPPYRETIEYINRIDRAMKAGEPLPPAPKPATEEIP